HVYLWVEKKLTRASIEERGAQKRHAQMRARAEIPSGDARQRRCVNAGISRLLFLGTDRTSHPKN
ncbi:MAG TPA: hypothetical protein PK156_49330, partial [Polyangium sp.]|nr:hypothetical protein [Polyangium sp.]